MERRATILRIKSRRYWWTVQRKARLRKRFIAASAKRRNPAIEESIFNFLRDILLFRFPENLDAQGREEHMHFVLKFQQFTGPIMAKGVEDTVFYIYNRLAALNEVGGDPQQFGISVDAFHERNLDRNRN